MKKYELKAEDQKSIARGEKEDVIIRFLCRQDEFRFNIGDILIKQIKVGYKEDVKWENEEVSYVTKTPKKFIYVHENTFGVGYIKQIKADGKTDGAIYAMTEFDPLNIRFQLDPDYADHIMLSNEGEEFDFHAAYKHKKKFREAAYKANKKLLISMDTPLERARFANSLNVGDKFWSSTSMDEMVKTQYEVIAIKKTDMNTSLDQWERKRWRDECERYPGLSDLLIVELELLTLSSSYAPQAGKTYTWKYNNLSRFTCIKPPSPMTEDIT